MPIIIKQDNQKCTIENFNPRFALNWIDILDNLELYGVYLKMNYAGEPKLIVKGKRYNIPCNFVDVIEKNNFMEVKA